MNSNEDEERLCHPLLTQCLNGCLVSDSSANTAYINIVSPKWDWLQFAEDIKISSSTEEACEDRLAALRYLDGKFQLKHTPGAKKTDIAKPFNKTKEICNEM